MRTPWSSRETSTLLNSKSEVGSVGRGQIVQHSNERPMVPRVLPLRTSCISSEDDNTSMDDFVD
jgi:hypothetical protein